MKISQHFLHSGDLFFRYRSYIPLLLIPILIAGFTGYRYPGDSHLRDLIWELTCFGISLLGLGIRIAVSGTAPVGTSGRNTSHQIASTLNTTGMYSIVRHPLYLGNYLIMLGASLLPRRITLPVIFSLLFVIYYERIIYREEQFLERKFGAQFREWARKTPLIIPNPFRYSPSISPFSWRLAIKREFHTIFEVIAIFFFAEIVADYFAKRRLVLDPIWTTLFILGAVFYISIRHLKKHSRIFSASHNQQA